jgi:hypothetical protein
MMTMRLTKTVAFVFLVICTHSAIAQTFREVTFLPTTGDFGLASNWSDPTHPPPVNPPGAPNSEYGGTFYYINNNRTATINAGSPNGSSFQVWHFFPGDSPSFLPATPPSPGTLIMNGGPPPMPGEFGAKLEVPGINRLILGQRCNMGGTTHGMDPCTGNGTIIMNGASDILADGIVVGERDFGTMMIGPQARVRSGHLNESAVLVRQDFRIGSFGPSRGETEPIPVRLNGNGLVVVQGTLTANTLYMPESGATGELRLEGGTINLRGLDMRFESFRASRHSKLSIIGSQGSFTVSPLDILGGHPSVTFSFTADAGGVVPIVGTAGAEIESANLMLDLDDYNFTPTSTLTLLDVQPDLLIGTFGNVTFMGNTTATVNYDYPNGNIFLSDFQRTITGVDGDYNNNGVVDGADYVVWRNFLGTTTTLPHDTTPGSVLQVDYDVWRSHFGMTGGSGTSLAAVPEPGCYSIAMLLVLWCAAKPNKRCGKA